LIDRRLSQLRKKAESVRPLLVCLRCGNRWHGLWIDRPPRYCARCHSAGWNVPPKLRNARTPDQPPNPNWDKKQGQAQAQLAQPASPSTVIYVRTGPDTLTLGLPATGLPPPPQVDAPRLPPPPAEPAGEEFARPSLPEIVEESSHFAQPRTDDFGEEESPNEPDSGTESAEPADQT
jgi:hypothetical protein